VSEGETALDTRAGEPPSPTVLRRVVLIVGWLAAVALVLLVLHLLGVDVEGWFTSLWDALTAVDPEYVALGLGLQTVETLLSAIAWLAIVRAAYPNAGIEALPIVTAYAVAVAGNDVLPASLGTIVMLVMLATIIPGATFPGLVGAQVVHKLFFVAAGAFVYLYLVLSVPGSFSLQLGLVADHLAAAIAIGLAAIVGVVLVVRAFWSKLRGLWTRAKQGGAILGDTRAFVVKVLVPELGAWLCKLGVIGVFLAAYGIPVTLHTIMSVAGGNSLANVVSVTPGGAGVNQAVNSAALTHEDVDRSTALAYSAGQQLVTTAWSVGLAVILVAVAFGWNGGKELLRQSYGEARTRAHRTKSSDSHDPDPS
jgi:phosphatidylinositol alpha-mannosyltransferase